MSETYEGFRQDDPTVKGTPFVYSSEELKALGGIRTKQCNLTLLYGLNGAANDLYFQLFESAPSSGDVPEIVIAVPRGANFSWTPSQGGRVFTKLYFAVSTTLETYTATSDGFWVTAEGIEL
jgi:hypothetical protein